MRVGIIGFGNMGSAIAERIKSKYELTVFDKDNAKTGNIKGINVSDSLKELADKADAVILAVKPQDFDEVLEALEGYVKGKLIISIAAGVYIDYIEKKLRKSRVIRVMPNIGIKIGESVTCLSKGVSAVDDDLIFATELFGFMGVVKEIDESLMNAATAISGSGPGYIFYFIEKEALDSEDVSKNTRLDIIEKLKGAAEGLGFSQADADFLAVNTTESSLKLLTVTKLKPAQLKSQVTSKGGTTEAALKIFDKGGSWLEAAQAALKRAEELSARR